MLAVQVYLKSHKDNVLMLAVQVYLKSHKDNVLSNVGSTSLSQIT